MLEKTLAKYRKLKTWQNPQRVKNVKVDFETTTRHDDCGGATYYRPDEITLQIGTGCKKKIQRAVLLHELAHIDAGEDTKHGKVWRERYFRAMHEVAGKEPDMKDLMRHFPNAIIDDLAIRLV